MKRAVLWLPALLLAFVLTACRGASKPSWPELIDLGQKYLIELDYEQAILTFTQAIELEPQRGEAYIGRGDAYAALAEGADSPENYQNARADYEAGASYLNPSWDLVEKLAGVYAAQGDADALQALLQQAAGTLGSGGDLDGLLGKYGYVQDESGTVKQLSGDELLEELYNYNWQVSPYIYNNLWPLSYFEKNLRPAVAPLQRLIDAEPERAEEYGAMLADVYYLLGEMDHVLETRRWLYELTGNEIYSPEGHTQTGTGESVAPDGSTYTEAVEYQYNGYGQITVSIYADRISYTEFNERGQMTSSRDEYASGERYAESEYLYDTEGRIAQKTFSAQSLSDIQKYSYDGNQVHVVTERTVNGSTEQIGETTYNLDEYN